ncbi:hypothetical protein F939_00884 [Acinetobacter radioresistens DSM 6976 = NBRC 102413 = CIP 103788]|jgi:type IV fimbrial biogenesis protein FimT|uniref:prepilin-type N-terminal cleavage/methylation domain-containing protein n=1 Tax=Acinetobacter radioresistens TaxID=40216 RepID=UPI000277C69B|nr:prepilin-type N-terminal cleavage/methylation domain-containing protein [Acinetobacter radioresistens]EJO34397.1 prepilin-type cleavage/methylation N-terminal domain protein [Acinetobacter radioresistens WC-A-157]ENV90192.1 hypothetical protein F939_00884 [Acinetobacter radioresistens DSM 6976 = NBRC 102413 = CIP 103788]MCU4516419.1 prepilin-type N-terminal cleavage/methylation domain-containing protein [Acinetobacter radioresistens]BBL21860.1 hypothetical protein ACRAD_25310 [Acinetobacter 
MQLKRGFTLVELMVTIAVMAIIAMIAAPNFSAMQENRQVQKTVRDLASILTIARSNSAIYRKPVTVYLKKDGQSDSQHIYWNSNNEKTEIKFYTAECRDKILKEKQENLETISFNIQGNVKDLQGHILISVRNNKAEQFLRLTGFGRVEVLPNSGLGSECT